MDRQLHDTTMPEGELSPGLGEGEPSPPFLVRPSSSIDEGLECRVCRGEAEENRPLYAPCLCSGSIMFTHQVIYNDSIRTDFRDYDSFDAGTVIILSFKE